MPKKAPGGIRKRRSTSKFKKVSNNGSHKHRKSPLARFFGGKANGCWFFLAAVVQGDGNQEQLFLKYQGNCGLMAAKRASNHLFIRAIDQRMFGGQQACPNKTAAILAKLPSSTTSPVVSQNNNHHGLHMSSVENPYDILLYWLVNRDPYVMAYEIIPTNNWVGWRHPLQYIKQPTRLLTCLFSSLAPHGPALSHVHSRNVC